MEIDQGSDPRSEMNGEADWIVDDVDVNVNVNIDVMC